MLAKRIHTSSNTRPLSFPHSTSTPQSSRSHNPPDVRPLPRPPRLAEEDECPVCHHELPSSALRNAEDVRAAHISDCIERSLGRSSSFSLPSTSVPLATTAVPASTATSHQTGGPTSISQTTTVPTAQQSQAFATAQQHVQRSIRRSGVFPYKATEKDCVDDAECTICLENYEVGVEMGRLECFCRFHLKCIRAWFEGRPGQCPVHQHDAIGY